MESFRYNRKKNNDFNQKSELSFSLCLKLSLLFSLFVVRNTILTQENSKLVKAIEEIHFRSPKSSMFATVDGKGEKLRKDGNSSCLKTGSLNYFTRRAENDRIYQENMILFSKLKKSTAIL